MEMNSNNNNQKSCIFRTHRPCVSTLVSADSLIECWRWRWQRDAHHSLNFHVWNDCDDHDAHLINCFDYSLFELRCALCVSVIVFLRHNNNNSTNRFEKKSEIATKEEDFSGFSSSQRKFPKKNENDFSSVFTHTRVQWQTLRDRNDSDDK